MKGDFESNKEKIKSVMEEKWECTIEESYVMLKELSDEYFDDLSSVVKDEEDGFDDDDEFGDESESEDSESENEDEDDDGSFDDDLLNPEKNTDEEDDEDNADGMEDEDENSKNENITDGLAKSIIQRPKIKIQK